MQHVLVADQSRDTSTFVHHVLESTGEYRVTETAGGEQAVSVLDADRPDLMILDLVMRGMPGIELATHGVERGIPVIVTTGEAAVDTRLARLGWPHLRKPFDADELIFECHGTLAESRRNVRIVHESLQNLLRTKGELRNLLGEMRALRARLRSTVAASRRRHYQ